MAYNIVDNPLLANKLLGPTDLAAHQRVAEVLLGFAAVPEFKTTGTDAVKRQQAEDAIALQVSYQVESGIEAFVMTDVIRGARRVRFRGGSKHMRVLHPIARKLSTALLQSAVRAPLR